MVTADWIPFAQDELEKLKVDHRNYKLTRNHVATICRAMFRGELFVLVGPSRVGKTKCSRDALNIPDRNIPDEHGNMCTVIVEAKNDGPSGEFSTKAFALECLRAIHQPIFGTEFEDDPWGKKGDEIRDKAPERKLWSAFEHALKLRKTEYLVIDEAHHVRYTRGGDRAAARVLDSWKCLCNRTKVKLVLIGSYELLSLLALAPHLLGRQLLLEFPRYRSDKRSDVEAWEQLLRRFSEVLKFNAGESLSTWNRTLFEGSLGRTGGLSIWLRSSLAKMQAEGLSYITLDILEATRSPVLHESAILEEIVQGERNLLRYHAPTRTQAAAQSSSALIATQTKRKSTPFRRKPKRNPINGRT